MKIKQVYRTVCLLGFGMRGERIPIDDFLTALNMALNTLNSRAPIRETKEIHIDRADIAKGVLRADAKTYFNTLLYDTGIAECRGRITKAWFDRETVYIPTAAFADLVPKEGCNITLKYYRKPKTATAEDFELNQTIDINPIAEHLLSYLAAAIFWADLEPELAEVYREFYETHIKDIDNTQKGSAIAQGFSTCYSAPWLNGLA